MSLDIYIICGAEEVYVAVLDKILYVINFVEPAWQIISVGIAAINYSVSDESIS